MHWICSTRHGNQTTTYSHFISIKTRIIEVITSNNRCHSHSHSSRSSSGDIDGGTNDKHDNNDSDGGVLSKSKCKTLFSRHFARILIVILVSFTFADMVHGKCHILWNPNFMLFTNDQTKTLSSIPCDSQFAHTHTHSPRLFLEQIEFDEPPYAWQIKWFLSSISVSATFRHRFHATFACICLLVNVDDSLFLMV